MPVISEQDKQDLKRRLQKELKADVTLKLFTQAGSGLLIIPGRECRYCKETEEMLKELVSLSPKLHLEVIDFYAKPEEARKLGVERIPAIAISADGKRVLRYYGIPAGYEFVTLLEDIFTVSKGVSPLKVETRKKLRQVNQAVHLQVFVTPT